MKLLVVETIQSSISRIFPKTQSKVEESKLGNFLTEEKKILLIQLFSTKNELFDFLRAPFLISVKKSQIKTLTSLISNSIWRISLSVRAKFDFNRQGLRRNRFSTSRSTVSRCTSLLDWKCERTFGENANACFLRLGD